MSGGFFNQNSPSGNPLGPGVKTAFAVINGNLGHILFAHNIGGFATSGAGQYTIDISAAGFTNPDSIAAMGCSADLTFKPGGYLTFETLSVTSLAINFQVPDSTVPAQFTLTDGIFNVWVIGV